MIAACGIDYSVCDIHLASSNPEIAERLVKVFVNMGHKDAKPEWFQCEGCSGDRDVHWSSNCEMMLCCFEKKHLENCSQCDEFMCERIDKFANDGFKHHQEGVECLKKMVADRGSKMKIDYIDVSESRDLVHVYNEQLKDFPHFYPVLSEEFEDGVINRNNPSNPHADIHSEKIIIGEQDSKILGFAHVSIGEIKNFGHKKIGGFIHFLTYQVGYRPIGQAILEECEKYLKGLGVNQIWAFWDASNYRFYHLGFGYLSDKMGHVLGLFRMNKYEVDIGEIFMSYPEYHINEPALPDDQVEIVVTKMAGRGLMPNLHLQAIRNGEKIGECLTFSVGEFYLADEAQKWFFTKWLGIEEKEQGKRLGHYLLQRTFCEMRKIGYRNALISTNVKNHRAQLFYTNFGYQIVDTAYGLVKNFGSSE